jgi:hypothetical protein
MYLCSVIKKQRLQEAAGASQSPANVLSRYKKKRVLQEHPPGKKKDKTFFVCRKTKIRFSFRSRKYPERKKRSLKNTV